MSEATDGSIIDIRVNIGTSLIYDPTVTAYINKFDTSKSFICPSCGTHYIAREPGFIPNCHNCGSVMQMG